MYKENEDFQKAVDGLKYSRSFCEITNDRRKLCMIKLQDILLTQRYLTEIKEADATNLGGETPV